MQTTPIRYRGLAFFESGPARVEVGDLRLRHAVQPTIHSDGVALHSRGREARDITQAGSLLGDDIESLASQAAVIEEQINGEPGTLVDHLGRTWPNTVMLSFDPGEPVRVGARWKLDYRVRYVQVRP